MNRFFLFIFYILTSLQTSYGQDFPKPEADPQSNKIVQFLAANNYSAANSYNNSLLAKAPLDGVNYYNRAVITYSQIKKFDHYNINIVSDCKTAQLNGYKSPELYYLLFLEYYYYNLIDIRNPPNYTTYKKLESMYSTGKKVIGYYEVKAFIDSAINATFHNDKYIIARFKLYQEKEIITVNYESHKDESPTIKSDCEKILNYKTSNKIRFLSFYYLSQIYLHYYADTINAIKSLSSAIDFYNSYNVPLKNAKYNPQYDGLYVERGKLRDATDNFEGAIDDYTLYLSKWDDAEVYKQRSLVYFVLNNLEASLIDINKSIFLFNEDRKANLKSAIDKIQIDFNNYDLGSAYSFRGTLNEILGRNKEALNDYNTAIEYGFTGATDDKNRLVEVLSNPTNENIQNSAVPMIKKNGVYEIPVTINGTLNINFIFDAGAADVSISTDVALTLIRTGTITDKDFIGTQTYQFADGTKAKSKILILKQLQIGNKIVYNVRATISNSLNAPLLLGQSALNRFGNISIDYKNMVVRFEN
jgi:aspartyl protease family protein